MNLDDIINGAIGTFDNNCAGYMNPGASGNGYIATLKLSVGSVEADMDEGLERIVSYDTCETTDAYIGQINMLTASSFCGLNGAIWGYDLAKSESYSENKCLLTVKQGKSEVPVYDVFPLLDTTYRLFGTRNQKRFAPLPGAMVICANKNAYTSIKGGPVWCVIALAIASNRQIHSNLFMEDCDASAPIQPDEYVQMMSQAIAECGQNQGVEYERIFIGCKSLTVPSGTIGCALTCAPYVTLAKNAIPSGSKASDLMNMSISQWEEALGLRPLPPYPVHSNS
uniref:Histidine decarboxylase n=1 Tax=Derbesia sp. WEST4838 TaxID=1847751 RepID=A0A1C9JBK2_9CHLO|nr:hypothetical protein [Derbesia sp. WEST4838]AOP19222.1 hypothetical protein [Derbesia sp. WEST4838]